MSLVDALSFVYALWKKIMLTAIVFSAITMIDLFVCRLSARTRRTYVIFNLYHAQSKIKDLKHTPLFIFKN